MKIISTLILLLLAISCNGQAIKVVDKPDRLVIYKLGGDSTQQDYLFKIPDRHDRFQYIASDNKLFCIWYVKDWDKYTMFHLEYCLYKQDTSYYIGKDFILDLPKRQVPKPYIYIDGVYLSNQVTKTRISLLLDYEDIVKQIKGWGLKEAEY